MLFVQSVELRIDTYWNFIKELMEINVEQGYETALGLLLLSIAYFKLGEVNDG